MLSFTDQSSDELGVIMSYSFLCGASDSNQNENNNKESSKELLSSSSNAPAVVEDKQEYVKILTFGDSLTEGYHRCGFSFHPYSIELERSIDAKFSNANSQREVLIHQFTDHMIPRLSNILEKATSSSYPYRVVCVLAGTNDLSSDDNAEDIFSRLKELYTQVLAHGGDQGIILVTITLPQAAFLDDDYVERRAAINSKIKEYTSHHSSSSNSNSNSNSNDDSIKIKNHQQQVVCVDLEEGLPYFTPEGVKDTHHWDDALHMTPAGYDQFGRLVFSRLESHLESMV